MRQSNVATHLVVMNFLEEISNSGALSTNLRDTATRGGVKIKDAELYVRAYIGGAAGIHEIVKDTVDKAVGVCNINKGVLPSNEAFVIEEVSVSGAMGDDAVSAGSVAYGPDIANAVKNAELVALQNGREVFNMPVARIANTGGTPTSANDAAFKLKSFAYLNDAEYLTWVLRFPNGVAVPAGVGAGTFPYLEIRFGGHKTEKV